MLCLAQEFYTQSELRFFTKRLEAQESDEIYGSLFKENVCMARIFKFLEFFRWLKINSIVLLYNKESESVSRSVVSNSLQPHGLWPTRLLCPWDSKGQRGEDHSTFL